MGAAAVWEALDQAPFGFILVLPEPARELHEPAACAAREPKPFSGQRRRAAAESGHIRLFPVTRGLTPSNGV